MKFCDIYHPKEVETQTLQVLSAKIVTWRLKETIAARNEAVASLQNSTKIVRQWSFNTGVCGNINSSKIIKTPSAHQIFLRGNFTNDNQWNNTISEVKAILIIRPCGGIVSAARGTKYNYRSQTCVTMTPYVYTTQNREANIMLQ